MPVFNIPGAEIVGADGVPVGRPWFFNYLFDSALIRVVDTSAGKI